MAHYEHLPIYKSALDLCIYFEKIVRHFDRHHKYMVGAHWYVGGEWHFGNCHGWEAAGSPSQVYFTRIRDIFGVDLH